MPRPVASRVSAARTQSAVIEQSYAAHLLDLGSDSGVGYLLKDRVSAVLTYLRA